MAPRKRRASAPPSSSPISVGNGYFVLANPKDTAAETKSLLQEVLTLYTKELPAMNYAANTGKQSMFLQRCVTNGKYCTLLLKSKDDKEPGKVIAAITYQIIPADTQYAEVPLAAVSSIFQYKGIGRLLCLELRKRLQSVGIRTLFCWADKESEGFWLKQGFTVIGEVDKKGKPRRLPIKADIRRALCFPGGSTLMVSNLVKDSSSESTELVSLCLPTKSLELNFSNQEQKHITEIHELSIEDNQIVKSGCLQPENLATEEKIVNGCQELALLPVTNASGVREGGNEDGEANCSCSVKGSNKRNWVASCTSLKSKKVKGTHSTECQLDSHCPVWTSNERFVANCLDQNCLLITGNENSGSHSMHELNKIIEDLGGVVSSDGSVCTHVVTGKVRQTLNFCTALCSGAWVISSGWLKESFKKGRFVDEMPFILKDEDYETKYRSELKSAVLRAQASPGALLKGLDIWLASHVQPPADILSAIVKSAGGNVIRTRNEIKNVTKTIFVACEEDTGEALLAVKLGIRTFSSEWLMNCTMRQELDLEAPQFTESL
ncbi:hypothetical protein MIMGU_mgv1a004022mg [Erythranthe guttata]|uniref:BRCT domain-containing protein n=1 Tax=Erythranthe guttata TaxID=4155 RepID=A0A022PT02_ERYGU|nr:hypothetical protein MIMGU_mgv1a004022mg [Erythranthe guttata]